MLMGQNLLVVLPTAYELNITNVHDCKWETEQNKGVCPFTSIVKGQTAKARSLGIKCVSLVDINFDGFSSAKLYQQQISCLPVFVKKIYNFPEISELPKFILPVKISWLIFSVVCRVEMKI